jgi:5-methylcytosine-specific restriction endonuclease McrBC GTP-binding regulatory subunit McrB
MSRVWSIIEWTKSEKDSKKNFKKYKEVSSSSSKGTSPSALSNPIQKIVHGAPGTGKSYNLEKDLENDHKIIRTVFHPETTHADFFGSYKPSTVQSVANANYESVSGLASLKSSPHIIYTFSPGPLMRAVKRALENPDVRVALIIEEINRAHAAAVFGEIFQLLDRDKGGISKYPIVISRDAWLYLNPDKGNANSSPEMVLPSNLSLYATMNAADQGVYPMDTAFKRRWTFEHLPIDGTSEATWKGEKWNPSVPILNDNKWQDFRQNLNAWLSRDSKATLETPIPEDKLLGPYFLNENDLKVPDNAIIEKVLFYIQFDVLRYEPTALFEASQTMSSLRDLADKAKLWGAFQTGFTGMFSAKADEQSPPEV